ncbi:MAG: MarR family winged helix-turn-helix transcriptional regulator [Deltaproteobacteria bacterium]|jgi:DNA-binding MarR family transcriptional regulator|nr:MarR family winged helix-turn-helix transcriptional regulator [Deltaproteobacteria bacterium]
MRTILKKIKPDCFCLKTRRLSAAVTKFYDRELLASGVTISQYSILLNITGAEYCSVRELADLSELDKSTLARNLKPLFAQELVVDVKEPGSRNRRLLLTVSGLKTLDMAKLLWAEGQKKMREKLGTVGQEALENVLDALENL